MRQHEVSLENPFVVESDSKDAALGFSNEDIAGIRAAGHDGIVVKPSTPEIGRHDRNGIEVVVFDKPQAAPSAAPRGQAMPDAGVSSKGTVASSQMTRIYHGTSAQAAKVIARAGFDVSSAADGTIWFTTDKSAIESGNVAATGKGAIVERLLDENRLKLGGWNETDKFSTDQLIAQGYDGLRLEDGGEVTFQIFFPEKLVAPKRNK